MAGHIYTDIASFDSIFQKRSEFSDIKELELLLKKFQNVTNSRFKLKSSQGTNCVVSTYSCARNW